MASMVFIARLIQAVPIRPTRYLDSSDNVFLVVHISLSVTLVLGLWHSSVMKISSDTGAVMSTTRILMLTVSPVEENSKEGSLQ